MSEEIPDLRTRSAHIAFGAERVLKVLGWMLLVGLFLFGIVAKGYREFVIWNR